MYVVSNFLACRSTKNLLKKRVQEIFSLATARYERPLKKSLTILVVIGLTTCSAPLAVISQQTDVRDGASDWNQFGVRALVLSCLRRRGGGTCNNGESQCASRSKLFDPARLIRENSDFASNHSRFDRRSRRTAPRRSS